jgi:putative zinc finger/helix-turn-helix YgiT family protein
VAREASRRCHRCGSGDLRESTETLAIVLPRSGTTASAVVAARRCDGCRSAEVDGSVMARFELAACRELANAGVHTGEAIRLMRKALHLRAADLARLLDLTPETISHWETGKCRPNRAAFVTLAALIQDAIDGRTTTRDRLAVLCEGGAYPRALLVDLG